MNDPVCTCLAGNPPFGKGPHNPTCPAYVKLLLPHEVILEVEGCKDHVNFVGDRYLWAGPDIEIGTVSSVAPGGSERWAKFFQAAPLMARALLASGETREIDSTPQWHTWDCHDALETLGKGPCLRDCEQTRAALIAAGVPLT